MNPDSLFEGEGEVCRLYREMDFEHTDLGPVSSWPTSLRTVVRVLLQSRFPMQLWWGPELLSIYNDSYRQILGDKHPGAMLAPASRVWAEIWDVLGPRTEVILRGEPATWDEHLLLLMNRKGYVEETYFTFSYSPVPDDAGAICGVLVTCQETTEQVQRERELATLRDLSARAMRAKSAEEACVACARVLSQSCEDVPFALLYLTSADGREARLVETVRVDRSDPRAAPARIALDRVGPSDAPWPLDEVVRASAPVSVSGLQSCALDLPRGPWASAPDAALCLPLARSGPGGPAGFLVIGVSPVRALDQRYRDFLGLVAEHVAASIASARGYEEERRRAEALAELDRAKTAFFSNVSHELRTPLTLILGPVEDAIASSSGALSGGGLGAVHRNALRLLKLVNTLLDFARIEAGRAQAAFQATDLAELTRDLASAFRSAFERARLGLDVDCPALPERVFVDREMWEKIVLNLLSNALKFTLSGGVRVALAWTVAGAELTVSDTGIGIPDSQLTRTFERFHRVPGVRARTHEGTGIGLALVRDMVLLHRGTIDVTSREGHGTTFTVRVPRGSAHLPREHVIAPLDGRPQPLRVASFVQEALGWIGDTADGDELSANVGAEATSAPHARVLIADDNADMRAYLARLLGERYQIETAEDGEKALASAQARAPDLIVTDIMMPGMDGLALLRALGSDPRTARVPVLALSARAGEEARVEGLGAGFQDYLVKPFSARTLLARVDALLARARIRAVEDEHRRRLQSIFEHAPVGICVLRGPNHVYEIANADYLRLVGNRPVLGLTVRDALPDIEGQGIYEGLDQVFATGETRVVKSNPVTLIENGLPVEHYMDWVWQPIRDEDGAVTGIVCVVFDVTDLAVARRQAETANRAKDEFLAMLGHELRNPLAPIATALHLMRLRAGGVVERERAIIARQVEHVTRLVDDLLDVSRIARGKIELRRARVEMSEVVTSAIETTSALLEQRRHKLTVGIQESGLTVFGDPARLAQIVSNLLGNAAKYTPPGGHISVTAERVGRMVDLHVRDDGIGISPEMLPRIFELFEQDAQSIARSQGGLGLGLAIVRSLAHIHGGAVQARSAGHGRGSEFLVRLPLADEGEEPAHARPPIAPARAPDRAGGGGRVLIVDDNEDAAELLAEALSDEGYDVSVANDGPEALRLADDVRPRLMLIDIGLPVMDGYELARRFRQVPAHDDARLVAITGYGQESDRERSRQAGFDAHLVKPVDLSVVIDIARDAMTTGGRRSEDVRLTRTDSSSY
ncbi:MAG: ATP-binding protein [Polyangiaceae bacterium]